MLATDRQRRAMKDQHGVTADEDKTRYEEMRSHDVNNTLALLARLRGLIENAQGIDTRYYEERDAKNIRESLVPDIERFLITAETLFAELFAHYESLAHDEGAGDSSPDLSFESRLDEIMSTSNTPQRIADIMFIARMELARKRSELERLTRTSDHWEYVAVCASARRRVIKSADSTERAICESLGLKSENKWYASSVMLAVAIRRAYAIFNHTLQGDISPTANDIYSRNRTVGIGLAKLIGRDIYEDLKIRDRRMLRTAQQRLLEWLRQGRDINDGDHVRAGLRIWQDIVGLGNLLMQVNNRPELYDHDALVLTELVDELSAEDSPDTFASPPQLQRLRTLYGLDDKLDQCIDRGEQCKLSEWLHTLEPLLHERRVGH